MTFKIAVIATEGIRLDAFLQGLEDSALAAAQLILLSPSAIDQSAVYGSRTLAFRLIDDFDFVGLDLCLVLEGKLVVEAYAETLAALTCPVLGFLADLQVLNAEPFSADSQAKVHGLYQPAVMALQAMLSGFDVEAIDATVLYPVSVHGQAGVEELAAQTAKLLNGQTVEAEFFHTQMTFNYYSMQASSLGRDLDKQFLSDLRLAFADAETSGRGIQMPVFHGIAMSLSLEFADVMSKEQFATILLANDSVKFHSDDLGLSNYEFVQSEVALSVGNVQMDAENAHRLECFVGFDEVKFAFGDYVIKASEKLLKCHL